MSVIWTDEAKSFKQEVSELMYKYGLCITHEDGHGAFMIEPFQTHLHEWFMEAELVEKTN